MKTLELIIETDDPTEVNKMVEDHMEDLNRGEGDRKTIIGANTKVPMDYLTPPMEAITIIIITVIIEAEVDMAMVTIITEAAAMEEAITEAITILI